MDRIEYVSVDKDVLDFYKVIYFGAIKDPMAATSDRAYLDVPPFLGKFPCFFQGILTLFSVILVYHKQ